LVGERAGTGDGAPPAGKPAHSAKRRPGRSRGIPFAPRHSVKWRAGGRRAVKGGGAKNTACPAVGPYHGEERTGGEDGGPDGGGPSHGGGERWMGVTADPTSGSLHCGSNR
jgi:hypothetical protein